MYCGPVNVHVIPGSVYQSWVWVAGHLHGAGSPARGSVGKGIRGPSGPPFPFSHSCVLGQPLLPLVLGFPGTSGFLFLFLLPLFLLSSRALGGPSSLHAGEPGVSPLQAL